MDKTLPACLEFIPYLAELCRSRPAPFAPGETEFWTDDHISRSMLAAHLDPTTDAASRRPETIECSVNWMVGTLKLKAGDSVLDLGCGPGLYASRLAKKGLSVTGLDYSRRSVKYAAEYACEHDLNIDYRVQDYLTLDEEELYDAVLLIYGDLCVLNPDQRALLLKNTHRALKTDGRFVLDVSTWVCQMRNGLRGSWHSETGGFWRPDPHVVIEQGFDYPEQEVWLDQYVVVDEQGHTAVYRNWFQDFTPETISSELAQAQFAVQSLWGDLTGRPYTADSEWIGVIAEKTATLPTYTQG